MSAHISSSVFPLYSNYIKLSLTALNTEVTTTTWNMINLLLRASQLPSLRQLLQKNYETVKKSGVAFGNGITIFLWRFSARMKILWYQTYDA